MSDKNETLDKLKEADDQYFEAMAIQNDDETEKKYSQIILEKLMALEEDISYGFRRIDNKIASIEEDLNLCSSSIEESNKTVNQLTSVVNSKKFKTDNKSSIDIADSVFTSRMNDIINLLDEHDKGKENIIAESHSIIKELVKDRNNILKLVEENNKNILNKINLLEKNILNNLLENNNNLLNLFENSKKLFEEKLSAIEILVEKDSFDIEEVDQNVAILHDSIDKIDETIEETNKNILNKIIILEKNILNKNKENNNFIFDKIDKFSESVKKELDSTTDLILTDNTRTTLAISDMLKEYSKSSIEQNEENNKNILAKINLLEKNILNKNNEYNANLVNYLAKEFEGVDGKFESLEESIEDVACDMQENEENLFVSLRNIGVQNNDVLDSHKNILNKIILLEKNIINNNSDNNLLLLENIKKLNTDVEKNISESIKSISNEFYISRDSVIITLEKYKNVLEEKLQKISSDNQPVSVLEETNSVVDIDEKLSTLENKLNEIIKLITSFVSFYGNG